MAVVYLLKTMEKKYLQDMVEQDRFCFCHPQVFCDWEEDDAAQHDRWEGHSAYGVCYIVAAPIISEELGKISYEQGKVVADRGIVRLQTDIAKNTPICCFRMVEEEELQCSNGKKTYSLGETVDRIRREFGHDAYILIRFKPFMDRIVKEESFFLARNVLYRDLLNDCQAELGDFEKGIIEQLFRKDARFAWQKEFRIILRPNKEEKSFVSIGSIEDIVYYGDIEELKHGKVI